MVHLSDLYTKIEFQNKKKYYESTQKMYVTFQMNSATQHDTPWLITFLHVCIRKFYKCKPSHRKHEIANSEWRNANEKSECNEPFSYFIIFRHYEKWWSAHSQRSHFESIFLVCVRALWIRHLSYFTFSSGKIPSDVLYNCNESRINCATNVSISYLF